MLSKLSLAAMADDSRSRGSGTSRAAAGMGAITAVSRAVGLVRVLAITFVLGTTSLGDAFQSANTLSNVLFEFLAAGALSAVLVPVFVDLLDRGDQAGAERVAGGVLGIALAFLGMVTVVAVLAAPMLARLLTLGVDPAVADDQRDLVTYLLRFFIPQVLVYAAGTIAIAVLYAKRRFAVTAAAPIGNTVVMIAFLAVFWAVAGPDPTLDLAGSERFLLAAAGTGGVLAFVGILLYACAKAGFRLRPRWPGRDGQIAAVLRHSGWGVTLHTAAGVLLGAAIVAGAGVEGGVVAYQVGWVIFLAPYAVFAQPIHTAILPELVTEARDPGPRQVAASVRWAMERMGLFVLPVTAGMVALATPAMQLISFGDTRSDLLAAAVAGLALGLLPYSAFLLVARGYYALGDSRTPGIAALVSAGAGVVVMVLSGVLFDGTARVAMLGIGHSVAYTVGVVILLIGLRRRTRGPLRPAGIGRVLVVSATVGIAVWAVSEAVLERSPGRLGAALVVAVSGFLGGLAVLAGYRVLRVKDALSPRQLNPDQAGGVPPEASR